MKKKLILGIICLVVLVASGFATYKVLDSKNKKPDDKQTEQPAENPPQEYKDTDYNVKLIKTVNSTVNGNYLISPYSIEIALQMLRDGAKGESKTQIDNLIGNRDIPTFSAKGRISVANAAFIKDSYKDYVEKSYYDKLATYDAEIIYDPFVSPSKINEWVNEKTYEMIPKILDDMSKDFVLGIANAVAIDVEWYNSFECNKTRSGEFTKTDGSKMNTEMMHELYSGGLTKYFETDDAKGIILPYTPYKSDGETDYEGQASSTKLEFVGILPNGSVDEYIEGLTKEKLASFDSNAITASRKVNISLYLPRFAYEFDLKEFKSVLIAMGVKDVFNPDNADLTGMISRENIKKMDADNIYVATAIHKTYIDLNEKGTKAAAVTYFGVDKAAAALEDDLEIKEITFNKPFVYMIRDSKTKEILFFGVVETPNEWKGSTCSEK